MSAHPFKNAEKTAAIDLGLALFSAIAEPGVRYDHEEIAAWCGCSRERIGQIETMALRKLRERMSPELFEELEALLHQDRREAIPTFAHELRE